MDDVEEAKSRAAQRALEFVVDGTVLVLGSGGTTRNFAIHLARRIQQEEMLVQVIPTSKDAEILSVDLGLHVATLEEHPIPDLAVDGADAVDPCLNLVKGGGGAMTREKILDYAAEKLVIIVDWTKLVETLFSRRIPLEVIPFCWRSVRNTLKSNFRSQANLRYCKGGKVGPVVTDNGNLILDVKFAEEEREVEKTDSSLKSLPCVVETGIFPARYVDSVIVGYKDRVEVLERSTL